MTIKDAAITPFEQGMDHVRQRNFEAAAECFRRAVEADPSDSLAYNNLGSTLAALGRHDQAIAAFRAALAIRPNDYPQAGVNLGDSLRATGNPAEAFDCFVRAVKIDPQYGPAYYALGQLHQASGGLNEALACYIRAMDLLPRDGDVLTSLGGVLMQLRQSDQAIQAFERALEIDPTMEVPRAQLMHLLAKDCDWERLEAHTPWIPQLGIVADVVPPFNLLAFEDHPQRHRIRSQRFAAASYGHISPLSAPARPAARAERLRIGYFSADYREHATMFLAARLFELHDRDRYSIHAYSYGRDESGMMRDRARKAFDEFKDVQALDDRAIAEMARADGIDIAVDLKGYTEHHRVGIFAYRPAPVQVTFLGYPGTLDAPFIDYLVADEVVVPAEQREGYAERLILLPHSYQANDDSRAIPSLQSTRAEVGLPEEGFVFCCFNNSYKITPIEFEIWMHLLNQAPGSSLWLLAGTPRVQGNLRAAASRRGVSPDRLVFAPKVGSSAHLARQRHADLFLDTFNCNAHTTASDALWAGLPVLTKAGKGFAARVAASLLRAAGLSELIAETDDEYAELALALARDPERLAAIRSRLADSRETVPLFDSALFTRHLEAGFELAYQRYLAGQEPADILVPAALGDPA